MARGPHMPTIDAADWARGAAKFAALAVLASIAALGLWLGASRVPRTAGASPAGPSRAAVREQNGDPATAPAPARASERSGAAAIAARIDLNAATQADLESLPGIGPALARRILDDRERFGPFATVESLTRVKGIGPKTLERLRPLIRAGGPGPSAGSPTAESGADETRTRNP